MGYGYPRPRNAGLGIELNRANVIDVMDAASGTIAHGELPPALSQSIASGITNGTRPLVVLGWAALALGVFVAIKGRMPRMPKV